MKVNTTYSVKIKEYNHIFDDTVRAYRSAVDFFIDVIRREWDALSNIPGKYATAQVEALTVTSKKRPIVKYDFGVDFYKFPSYLRRAAIAEAYGKVSSYHSNLKNWTKEGKGKKPALRGCGYVYPAMYRDNMFFRTGDYTARLKVWTRNTWDWIDVSFRKSDADYIAKHCNDRKERVPTLRRRGKQWFLDFSFEEKIELCKTETADMTVLAVDLGVNRAATCTAMSSDGTILGRHTLKLPREQDCLNHALNRIKKAQQHGNVKTPRLWAKAKGINDRIAVLTASFIVDKAKQHDCSVIVFEHLDTLGKKKGSQKQKIHHWRAQYVQSMTTTRAHRLGMRISHVNAWGTSRLAYDGSGKVERGNSAGLASYSLCRFQNGKVYDCDLSAAYNIGARYFIREKLKSLPETVRLQLEAKVPQACKRSTCTLSTLINLNAELELLLT